MYYKIVNKINDKYYSPFINMHEYLIESECGSVYRTVYPNKNYIRKISPKEYIINSYVYDDDFLCVYRNFDDILSYIRYYCNNKLPYGWRVFKCDIEKEIELPYYLNSVDLPIGTVLVTGVKLLKEVIP